MVTRVITGMLSKEQMERIIERVARRYLRTVASLQAELDDRILDFTTPAWIEFEDRMFSHYLDIARELVDEYSNACEDEAGQ